MSGGLQPTRYEYEHALSEDRREPVESGAYADKETLLLLCSSQHIEAVGSDIMSGRCESCDDKDEQGDVEERHGDVLGCYECALRMRYRQREQHEAEGHKHLHGHYPPPLRADDVDEGAP